METTWVLLARNGDRDAFIELVILYQEKIYQLAYRMLANRHEAEDVVQETFLRVFKNLHSYDPNLKFSTWIYRIGTNLCIDRLRKKKVTYSLDVDPDGEGLNGYSQLPSDEPNPETQVLISETQEKIQQAISELPEKYKSVVLLYYFHDFSLQEIAGILNMPATTIKTRLHRARDYLRKKISRENETK